MSAEGKRRRGSERRKRGRSLRRGEEEERKGGEREVVKERGEGEKRR